MFFLTQHDGLVVQERHKHSVLATKLSFLH